MQTSLGIKHSKHGKFRTTGNIPESINLHITERCNYHCKFCFARYANMERQLTLPEWKEVICELSKNGCKKVNFAGGEPTLVPFLPQLITYAKSMGMFVSIISNGTGIKGSFLDVCMNCLDIIGLSIDSANNETERCIGRTLGNKSTNGPLFHNHVDMIRTAAKLIHSRGIPLKINTTLTSLNWQEDMHPLLLELHPVRWKVFQVHRISGINDGFFNTYGALTNGRFSTFLKKHIDLHPIGEYSETIKESYCMITPDGRFYQDTHNKHNYSQPILRVGVEKAFQQVNFNVKKYLIRGGNFFKQRLIVRLGI